MENAVAQAVRVIALGNDGDGVAQTPQGRIFVPGTVPGDEILLAAHDGTHGTLARVVTPGADRVPAPCHLFGACGGCRIQDMALPALLDWKTGRVVEALRHVGFDAIPTPQAHQVGPHGRCRVDLAFRRVGKEIVLGLHRRRGDVVDMSECMLLDPTLFALLPPLRAMLRSLPAVHAGGDIQINLLDSGPDLLITMDGTPDANDRRILAQFGKAHGVPRISLQGRPPETLALTGPVFHHFDDVRVAPPPGAFLQPVRAGEAFIKAAVVAGLPRKGLKAGIIELYAGCGTLSFALAGLAKVHAYEGDRAALACLKQASGGTRVLPALRDLNRQPVMATDLAKAAAVVLDPPHAGAGAQIAQIVAGRPACVIYVSCNPAALQRDLTPLRHAGYRLDSVTVIDQFLWSAEVESVCVLTLPGAGRRNRR
ncbi:class I SAM-dependent RNA methyltransferase [Komagataeibacter swingsii]|uniref:23S rRNA methyltransferase n=1 Tax=Komagataeibacter swingsii TaxID=215220 RepID=A0A2V4SH43_9PROT|nr:class I SAM-dependent RNA methyltransferase [Komagataeibacter swingsii]PYD71374.1 23S rRNA methyltransferase [Komagataeibacter swingsii]GBQ63074.1 ribosomal large subunit 23S rRNA methyltransferase [Komagataeibacter swingsii DSM 16373]